MADVTNLTAGERQEISEILKRRANEIASFCDEYRSDPKHHGSVEMALSREMERLRGLAVRVSPEAARSETVATHSAQAFCDGNCSWRDHAPGCARANPPAGQPDSLQPDTPQAESFQARMHAWAVACFGEAITADKKERNHRFLEEAIELVQACGCTASEAHQLVDYVYGRPVGEPAQEVGGVFTTLAALCTAQDIDMIRAGEVELARIWTKVEQIRAKQAAKPKHSPLPMAQGATT